VARRDVRRFLPRVPVAGAEPVAGAVGFGVAGAASCASASNGSNTPDSVKPNAAPRPSIESIFLRERFSLIIHLPVPRLPRPVRQSKPFRMNAG
jgi:hypothetical protein